MSIKQVMGYHVCVKLLGDKIKWSMKEIKSVGKILQGCQVILKRVLGQDIENQRKLLPELTLNGYIGLYKGFHQLGRKSDVPTALGPQASSFLAGGGSALLTVCTAHPAAPEPMGVEGHTRSVLSTAAL